jgi:serine/threonine protein kinase
MLAQSRSHDPRARQGWTPVAGASGQVIRDDHSNLRLASMRHPVPPKLEVCELNRSPSPRTKPVYATKLDVTQNYELHEIVGKGGFGVVYRATHRPTARVVAIKIVSELS